MFYHQTIKNIDKTAMTDDAKQITTVTTPLSVFPRTPRSRRRKRSYAESGLETPEIASKSASKKLVYMQDISADDPAEKQLDLYEFDSDSEGVRRTRKKRAKRSGAKKTPSSVSRPKIAKKIIAMVEAAQSSELDGSPLRENFENVNLEVSADQNDGSEVLFGFDDVNKSKITIVKLKPNEELQFNAVPTDTVIGALTPWRFTDWNVTRNPHFIQLKDSSLPRLDQEMVLDYSLVDSFENSTKGVLPAKKSRKQRRQRNITDYFQRNTEVSLFEDGCLNEDILDTGATNDIFMDSTPKRHRYFNEEENDDDNIKLSVNVRDKKYSHKPKPNKMIGDNGEKVEAISGLENTFFRSNILLQTPKMKRKSRNYQSHRKMKGGQVGGAEVEEEETERLLANLSLEFEKIENFPLLIDD